MVVNATFNNISVDPKCLQKDHVRTPASSITKTGRHEIAEILLKVALISFQLIFKNTNVGPLYQESGAPGFITGFLWDSCCSIFNFLFLRRFTDSDYPFGIIKFF
jgi:hypothetical protein